MIQQSFRARLLAIGKEGTVAVSRLPEKSVLWISEPLQAHRGTITALAWSRDGKYLATGGSDAVIKIWEAETGRLLSNYYEHQHPVCALSWSPDSKKIASAAIQESPRIWKVLS
jgi:WD40 repeat protein